MRWFLLMIGLAGLLFTDAHPVMSADSTARESPAEATDLLTEVEQIRDLPPTETSRRLPVRLTGVMLDTAITDPRWRALILADHTASIYIIARLDYRGRNIFTPYHRGDLLEINGVTDAGQFAPIVIATSVKKLGTAPIPAAHPVTYQQLITGALDAQWVQIEGVVRRCFGSETNSDLKRIVIAVDGGLVQATYTRSQGPIQVDAEVCLRAVCFYQFNQRRQVLSPVLRVPQTVPVQVTKPAPVDPYDIPVRSPNSLLTFSPENLHAYAHRVHVRGVVTSSRSQSGSFIWIRDGNSGLRIQSNQKTKLSPGDKIDVLGFPAFGLNTPELEDAIFRKIGSTPPPVPILLTNFNDAFDHEDDLVAVKGTLTQVQPFMNEIAFTVNKQGKPFKAILKVVYVGQAYPSWQVGARVQIAGICTLVHDETQPAAGIWQPKSFQILLRSPADINILQPPPWWTLQHIAMLLGITTGALVLMIGVVVMFSRHRLHQQERQRQMAEAEFAAILSERNRLAREIHDTLAQGLTATSVQLRLARKNINGASEVASRCLDTALSLVGGSLEEARNSIWNMRSHALEQGGLTGAVNGILKQMADGTEMKTSFEIIGRRRQFAPVIENNVLRIGQEAITNAIKHSAAKYTKVVLEFGEKRFYLRVKDDGLGFDPQNPPATDGGFGLVGMQERAAEINGKLDVRSVPGQGTEVVLSFPLTGE